MSKVDAYSVYQQNQSYRNFVQGKKDSGKTAGSRNAADVSRAEKNSRAGNEVKLSERAQELLKELQKKYGNMDFIVADYESEEEAQDYLARGTKEFSVLIEPETLEEMAASEKAKQKYMTLIEESAKKLSGMKEELSEEKKGEVVHLGVSINNDGTVSYFADLEKNSARQRERIEQAREERKEEEKREEKNVSRNQRGEGDFMEAVKRTRVQSDSIEGLLEKIRSVDWSLVNGEGSYAGGRFDFMF